MRIRRMDDARNAVREIEMIALASDTLIELVSMTKDAGDYKYFQAVRVSKSLHQSNLGKRKVYGGRQDKYRIIEVLDPLVDSGLVLKATLIGELGNVYGGGSGVGYRADISNVKGIEEFIKSKSEELK
jgi:hypothetical protein